MRHRMRRFKHNVSQLHSAPRCTSLRRSTCAPIPKSWTSPWPVTTSAAFHVRIGAVTDLRYRQPVTFHWHYVCSQIGILTISAIGLRSAQILSTKQRSLASDYITLRRCRHYIIKLKGVSSVRHIVGAWHYQV